MRSFNRPAQCMAIVLLIGCIAQTAVGVSVPSASPAMMPQGGKLQATTKPSRPVLHVRKAGSDNLEYYFVRNTSGQTDPTAISPALSLFDGIVHFNVPDVGEQEGNLVGAMTLTRDLPGGDTYSALVTQCDISGGTLDTGVMFRESATFTSTGKVEILPDPIHGFLLTATFDLYLDWTVDGGGTWDPPTGPLGIELVSIPEPSGLAAAMLLTRIGRRRTHQRHTARDQKAACLA